MKTSRKKKKTAERDPLKFQILELTVYIIKLYK